MSLSYRMKTNRIGFIWFLLFCIEQWFRRVKCRLFRQNHFLSFIEEFVLNPAYDGYIGGRIEVYGNNPLGYADKEIRFFTMKADEFRAFRERWDFKDVTDKQLGDIEKKVAEEFSILSGSLPPA